MTTHVFPGLGCVPLINYLAALGVAKGISEQVDPAARFGWRDGVFHMDTEVEDVAGFFVRDFVPTPVFSPWNAGSGFGENDKTPLKYIRVMESSTATRLAPYRNALAVIRSVLAAKSRLIFFPSLVMISILSLPGFFTMVKFSLLNISVIL